MANELTVGGLAGGYEFGTYSAKLTDVVIDNSKTNPALVAKFQFTKGIYSGRFFSVYRTLYIKENLNENGTISQFAPGFREIAQDFKSVGAPGTTVLITNDNEELRKQYAQMLAGKEITLLYKPYQYTKNGVLVDGKKYQLTGFTKIEEPVKAPELPIGEPFATAEKEDELQEIGF